MRSLSRAQIDLFLERLIDAKMRENGIDPDDPNAVPDDPGRVRMNPQLAEMLPHHRFDDPLNDLRKRQRSFQGARDQTQ